MASLLDYTIHLAVERDGVPRQAAYDDGIDRMLYRDGDVVRSVELGAWAKEAADLAVRDLARTKRQALRASLRTAAAAHRGKRAAQLTLPELRDLVAVLLEAAGMLDDDGGIV